MVTQYKNQMECALPPPANAELAKEGPTSSPENVVPALLSFPICLPCHTTRHGSPKDTNSRFENVQCEAYHGSAGRHPDLRKDIEHVDEDDCRQCHNSTNSPNFNYDKYGQKILHPRVNVPNGKQ